ncbi:MAG: glycine zipper domain-containing protein [Phycisphaerae bacterium]
MKNQLTATVTAAALMLAGCESLPGGGKEQGAVIGGAGGAAAGAAISEDNRLVGALIGGVLGAGGGYLIGSRVDNDEGDAEQAAEEARRDPATVADARDADTADLNGDGFVSMDELIALNEAGYSDAEIRDRLEATDQVFQLDESQRARLVEAGLSRQLVVDMGRINREQLDAADTAGGRISRDR